MGEFMQYKIGTLFLFLLLTACNNYDFSNKFSVIPTSPQPGEEVQILFNASNTDLKSSDSISLIMYSYNHDILSTREFVMTKENGGWITKVTTEPDSKGFIIKFVNGDEEDNNDNKGYIVKLHNELGELLPEADAGLAVAYARWGVSAGLSRDREKAYNLFKDVFAKHPEIKSPFLSKYFYAVERVKPEEHEMAINTELSFLEAKSELTSLELGLLAKYYKVVDKVDLATKYEETLLADFPESEEAQEYYFNKINEAETALEGLTLLNEFENKFPESKFLSDAYTNAAFNLRKNKNFSELYDLLIKNPAKPELYIFYYAGTTLLENNFDLEKTTQLVKLGQERGIQELEAPQSEKPASMTMKEWKEEIKYYAGINAFVYGKALLKTDKPQLAITHLKEGVDYTTDYNNRDDINNAYVGCLIKVGEKEKAVTTLEEFISNGKSDSEMKETLKTLYVENKGSEEGFEEYLNVFETKAHGELIAKLKGEITSKPATDFELLDTKGNSVKLSDLKGKSLIVDFWATWCSPCRKSFPGMKMAVEKYADNENVEFLFVNTWENAEDKVKNANDFMKKNNYPFHVLMDEENKVVETFKVSGIPTKFIIDKNQNIRFISIGLSGSPEHIAEEIDVMLSMIE